MPFMPKTIFTGFAPNLTKQDVLTACSYLVFPWTWSAARKGPFVESLEHAIGDYFCAPPAVAYDSGRSALYMALKALGVGPGDEVLVQAYTCVVVINAIRFTGATPIFVDIGSDLCLDPLDVEKKITDNTTVMIIQHTFGQAADMDRLMSIASKHQLAVIEDCAHSLGATYKGKLLGTFGDIAMLSFGSDKVISCARGGALVTRNEQLAQVLRTERDELPAFSSGMLFRHLMHFPIFAIGRALYSFGIGKWFLAIMKRARVMNLVIERAEKKGRRVPYAPSRLPNALAHIAMQQFQEIDKANAHRRHVAALYFRAFHDTRGVRLQKTTTDSIFLRFVLLVDRPVILHARAKEKRILLGDWYNAVIAPKDTDISETGYIMGVCPRAEMYAAQSINLPTNRHITDADAARIIDLVRLCLHTQ